MRISRSASYSGGKYGKPWMWSQWKCVNKKMYPPARLGGADLLAELLDAAAGVDDQQLVIWQPYLEAGSIATEPHALGARGGNRATNAMEPYPQITAHPLFPATSLGASTR